MSRKAVSWELFVSFAHFFVVSLPSKPSSNRFSTFVWRSFRGLATKRCQKRAFRSALGAFEGAGGTLLNASRRTRLDVLPQADLDEVLAQGR